MEEGIGCAEPRRDSLRTDGGRCCEAGECDYNQNSRDPLGGCTHVCSLPNCQPVWKLVRQYRWAPRALGHH